MSIQRKQANKTFSNYVFLCDMTLAFCLSMHVLFDADKTHLPAQKHQTPFCPGPLLTYLQIEMKWHLRWLSTLSQRRGRAPHPSVTWGGPPRQWRRCESIRPIRLTVALGLKTDNFKHEAQQSIPTVEFQIVQVFALWRQKLFSCFWILRVTKQATLNDIRMAAARPLMTRITFLSWFPRPKLDPWFFPGQWCLFFEIQTSATSRN